MARLAWGSTVAFLQGARRNFYQARVASVLNKFTSGVVGLVMSRGGFKFLSNGRMAWVVTGAAVALLMALPTPSEAQSDGQAAARQRPVGPTNGGERRGRDTTIDLFDFRDAIDNSMVVGQPRTPGAQPMSSNEVVCLAGCDRGPGTVVYRDRPTATLASLSAPTPLPAARLDVAQAEIKPQQFGVLSCVAGCYEQPKLRTVASLRDAVIARTAGPVRTAARNPKPTTGANTEPLVTVAVVPTDADSPKTAKLDAEPVVRLRTAFTPNDTSPTPRSVTAKSRVRQQARGKGKRTHQYGKVVPVPVPAAAEPTTVAARPEPNPLPEQPLPDAVTVERAVPQVQPAKSGTPVTRFAPPRRSERRKPDQVGSKTAVSNDWFNKINRERREQEAAHKTTETAMD